MRHDGTSVIRRGRALLERKAPALDRDCDARVRRTGQADRQDRIRADQDRSEAKLREQLRDHEDGLALGRDNYTVRQAVEDWLTYGLGRQGSATVKKYRIFCGKHVIPLLGARKLLDLTTREVDAWLVELSKSLSTATLQRVHGCLNRSVRRAMARDLVKRNVVELADVPAGRAGRGRSR